MPGGIIRWLGLFLRHLFSTDHKVIGLLYGFTSLFFLLVGFSLVVIMRGQLAYPGRTPWIAPEVYHGLAALHGTIMVFLGVVPLAVGAFGNYLVPLQIGAPDMSFPRINLASYWFYAVGGVIMAWTAAIRQRRTTLRPSTNCICQSVGRRSSNSRART